MILHSALVARCEHDGGTDLVACGGVIEVFDEIARLTDLPEREITRNHTVKHLIPSFTRHRRQFGA